jgi:UDP-hydrolysing UDP-N-acetyl-D-glucosamine 2-epimerase
VSNETAAERVHKLGEREDAIFTVGCPSVDFIKSHDYKNKRDILEHINDKYDVRLNSDEPYLISVSHPVTTEFDDNADKIEEMVKALLKVGLQSIFIYPNIDAGSKLMASRLRQMESKFDMAKMFMFKHISNRNFLNLLKHAACLVGNSSSGIREACYFGTPVVNIGSRQVGHKRGMNVVDIGHESGDIFSAIGKQLDHGRYELEEVYGPGGSGEKIAEIMANIDLPPIQKRIVY